MLYDHIGAGYAARRTPDPRIADAITLALEGAQSIANVGAGTGSYELPDKTVIAIEPSMEMLRQRAPGLAPRVQAVAESLPLRDKCVSGATAILTIHHWSNLELGLQELVRISRDRIAIFTWDPDAPPFWLTKDYFPVLADRDRRRFPEIASLSRSLGCVAVQTVSIPCDCVDGFLGAYWRRPTAYLDPAIRSGMSGFRCLEGIDAGLAKLRDDIATGDWERRNGDILEFESMDLGYRLVIAELT